MKAAQTAFVLLTVLFLASAMTLFLLGEAVVAAVVFMAVAIFGFFVFMAMIITDAGGFPKPPG